MQHYSDTYGLTYQCVARMKQRGYDLGNPKKLLKQIEDQPGGNKPDLTVLRAIVNGDSSTLQDEPEPSAPSEPPSTQSDAVEGDPPPEAEAVQFSMAVAGGLMDELARLKSETLKSYRLYLAELRPADRMTRNKIWLANVAALRQLAKEAPKAERDAKNVLLVGDVDATWSRTLKEFKSSLESLGRRISTLPLFAELDPIDVEQVVAKEVVVILEHLESGSHLKTATT